MREPREEPIALREMIRAIDAKKKAPELTPDGDVAACATVQRGRLQQLGVIRNATFLIAEQGPVRIPEPSTD